MSSADSFAKVTRMIPMAKPPQQRSASHSHRAHDTSPHDHNPERASSELPSQPRSRSVAQNHELHRSPASSRTQYKAFSPSSRQEINGQSNVYLDTDTNQPSQDRSSMNTTSPPRSLVNTQPLLRRTEVPHAQHTKNIPVESADKFPNQRVEQPPTECKKEVGPPSEKQRSLQVLALPYHPRKEVSQTNQADHIIFQPPKQSRPQHAEQVHVQRMAQNRIHHTVQIHLQPVEQLKSRCEDQLGAQNEEPHWKNELRPQVQEQQIHPRVEQSLETGNERLHSPRVKPPHTLYPEHPSSNHLEHPSAQPSELASKRVAQQTLFQPKGESFRQHTDSIFPISPYQHSRPTPPSQMNRQVLTQHRIKRKQPPPPLRPKLSMLSIKVHPPTPQKPQTTSSSSSPALPTLSSLNVSKIPPQPVTSSERKAWIDRVNTENVLEIPYLLEVSAMASDGRSRTGRRDSLVVETESLGLGNVAVRRRGSWASLKSVVRKLSGSLLRLKESDRSPLGKK